MIKPPHGYRTYRLHLMSLFLGASIAVFGIQHGSDLLGLAALVTAVVLPIAGSAAANNIGTGKVTNGNGGDG